MLRTGEIFNACDPSLLHDVAIQYGEDWWSPQLDPLRQLLREWFFELFALSCDYFTRLEESIKREGVLNPVIVTAGPSLRRASWQVPENCGTYICESAGGSRLAIAQRLGIAVPAIINDQIGVAGEILKDQDAVFTKFSDKTYRITYGPPVIATPARYSHMPEGHTIEDQQRLRRATKPEMIRRAELWRQAHWVT